MVRLTTFLALGLAASLLTTACGDPAGGAPTAAPSGAPASAKASASGSASVAPSASVASSASAAPAPSAKADAKIVQAFRGPFEAKKQKMKLPPGASEPFWGLDKGKHNVGKGEMTLSVWSDGRVTGTVTGPLGDLTVEGHSEEGALTGALTPKEPGGFRGTIAGKIDGNKFVGELQASSRDVTIVREAALSLDKS